MRLYSADEELRVRLQRTVGDWARSEMLTSDQSARLQADLRVDVRRTGLMLRLGLALFTVLVVGASVGLVFLFLNLREETAFGLTLLVLGALCLGLADVCVSRFRFYRHGIEEALAVCGIALLGPAVALLASDVWLANHTSAAIAVGLGVCAVASLLVYARFGFQYAGVAAMFFAQAITLTFEHVDVSSKRFISAAVFGVALVMAHVMRQRVRAEHLEDDAEMFRAAGLAGVYGSLNMFALIGPWTLFGLGVEPWFRTTSYVLTWVLPCVGIQAAIQLRDKRLLDVALALALVSLVTNKPYLGLLARPWDPMLLGGFLAVVAVCVRRWLAAGPRGERAGFTPVQLLASEGRALQVASLASVAVQPGPVGESSPTHAEFRGGRSGGAGADDHF